MSLFAAYSKDFLAQSDWFKPDSLIAASVAVLEIPPVTSPETAVKVAIAAKVKGKSEGGISN